MAYNKIESIYKKLHWKNSKEIQEEGIKEALKIKDLSYFMQPLDPKYNKSIWNNCANIIVQREDAELRSYIRPMMEWLQDINWPGAFTIKERLDKMSADDLIEPYLTCIEDAIREGEESTWLDYLAGLIDNEELFYLLPDDKRKLMREKYKIFWGYGRSKLVEDR